MAILTNTQASPLLVPQRILFVNLNSLLKSDPLLDSVLWLARYQPAALLQLPRWLAAGPVSFRVHVESAASLDVAHLPFQHELLIFIRRQRAQGRRIYLATDGSGRLAQRIIEHLGLFDGWVAVNGEEESTRELRKLSAPPHWPPDEGFDYAGGSVADLKHLLSATERTTANADRGLLRALRQNHITPDYLFEDRARPLRAVREALRLHQWAKNVLLFVPLLLAHAIATRTVLATVAAFFCFSLCASGTYVINDLLDLDADRRHPRKKRRPFAAGDLSASTGLTLAVVCLGAGMAGAWFLSTLFLGWLMAYLVVTLAYSLALKKKVLVDVVILATLYTVRLLAGAAVSHTAISPWLSGFSLFLFLSLAMVKRFSELENLRAGGRAPSNGRGYLLLDMETLRSFGTASGYASVVVFALYISGPDVMALYRHPNRMWLMAPLLILWISRFWLLASRGELDEDPVVFALTDRTSLLIGACIVLIGLFAI